MCIIVSRQVPTTSVFAGLLKPMWLSLIWTKFSSAVAIALRLLASWPNTVEVKSPPLMDQITPVPAQAIHLRNPRRSMPSSLVFVSMKSDIMVGTLVHRIGRAIAHPSSGTYRLRSEIIPAAPENGIGNKLQRKPVGFIVG